jgi:hypothetical protein
VALMLQGLASALMYLHVSTDAAIDNAIPMTAEGIWLTLHLLSIGLERGADQPDESARKDYQFEFLPTRNTYDGMLRWLSYKSGLEPPTLRLESDYGAGRYGQVRVVVDDENLDWDSIQFGWVGSLVGRIIANGIIPGVDVRLHCLQQSPLLPWTFADQLPAYGSPVLGPLWERRSFTDALRLDESRSLFAQVTGEEWKQDRSRLRRLHSESTQEGLAPGSIFVYLTDYKECPYLLADYGIPLEVEQINPRLGLRPWDVDGFKFWDGFPRPPVCHPVPGTDQLLQVQGNYPDVWKFVHGFALNIPERVVTEEVGIPESVVGNVPTLYTDEYVIESELVLQWTLFSRIGVWPTLWDPSGGGEGVEVETTLLLGNFPTGMTTFEHGFGAGLPFYVGAGILVTSTGIPLDEMDFPLVEGSAAEFVTGFGRLNQIVPVVTVTTSIEGGDPWVAGFVDTFGIPFYQAARSLETISAGVETIDGIPFVGGGFYAAATNEYVESQTVIPTSTIAGAFVVDGDAYDFVEGFGSLDLAVFACDLVNALVGGSEDVATFESGFGSGIPFYHAGELVGVEYCSETIEPGIAFDRYFYATAEDRIRYQLQEVLYPGFEQAGSEWLYYPARDQVVATAPTEVCEPDWFELYGSEVIEEPETETLLTWRRRGNFRIEPMYVVIPGQDTAAVDGIYGSNGWDFVTGFGSENFVLMGLPPLSVDPDVLEIEDAGGIPPLEVDPYDSGSLNMSPFYFPAQQGIPAASTADSLGMVPWIVGAVARFDRPYVESFVAMADLPVAQELPRTTSTRRDYGIPNVREAFTRRKVTRFYEIITEPLFPDITERYPRLNEMMTGSWVLHLGYGDPDWGDLPPDGPGPIFSSDIILTPESRWWTDLEREKRDPFPVIDQGQISLALEFGHPRGETRRIREVELRLNDEVVHYRRIGLDLAEDENLGVVMLIRATLADPYSVNYPAFRSGEGKMGDPLRDRDYRAVLVG